MSGKRSRAARSASTRAAKIKHQERTSLGLRALVIFWTLFALSAVLITRLYVVQIRDGRSLAADASEEQQATYALNPKRGDIIDRFGGGSTRGRRFASDTSVRRSDHGKPQHLCLSGAQST